MRSVEELETLLKNIGFKVESSRKLKNYYHYNDYFIFDNYDVITPNNLEFIMNNDVESLYNYLISKFKFELRKRKIDYLLG